MLPFELKSNRSGQMVSAEIDVKNPQLEEDHFPIVVMVDMSVFIVSLASD